MNRTDIRTFVAFVMLSLFIVVMAGCQSAGKTVAEPVDAAGRTHFTAEKHNKDGSFSRVVYSSPKNQTVKDLKVDPTTGKVSVSGIESDPQYDEAGNFVGASTPAMISAMAIQSQERQMLMQWLMTITAGALQNAGLPVVDPPRPEPPPSPPPEEEDTDSN